MPHFSKKQTFHHKLLFIYIKDPNQPQFLPYDVKAVLKRMTREQGLYTQAVVIRQNNSDNKNYEIVWNISTKTWRPEVLEEMLYAITLI